jgi:hypothetical protein
MYDTLFIVLKQIIVLVYYVLEVTNLLIALIFLASI